MKKILGITFGGLQQKTVRLVLILVLAAIGAFAVITAFQSKMLAQVVEKARVEQQQSISSISQETMQNMLEQSFVATNGLQADMADGDFSEVISYIRIMQTMAQGLFEGMDSIEPVEVLPPDPEKDGILGAHALCEAGVDISKSKYLGIAGLMIDPLIAMCSNSSRIGSCYVGLSDGTHLSIDTHTANRYDENGKLKPYPVRKRPWYRGAAITKELYFTGIETDAFTGEMQITCSAPVFLKEKVVAVVGADIILEAMNGFLQSSGDGASDIFVINSSGQVLLAPENNELFSLEVADEAQNLLESDNESLAQFVGKALKEKTGLTEFKIGKTDYYAAGSPMPSVGWAVITLIEKELTQYPETQMLSQMAEINKNAQDIFNSGKSQITRILVLIILGILILSSIIAVISAGRIVKPVEEMTRNIIDSSRTGCLFEMKDDYRTGDEIEVLAESFDDLSKKTKRYIEDITRITKEKERISTELDLARKIQEDMLPYIYPAFPDRPEFDVFATMNPAREVGGDFYDFFLIDQDHLGLVMADVSGKGVPAALFMMMSKILINNFAMMGGDPATVLQQTNTAICQNNEEDMFITAWFGILEISTGVLTAANAGHEYPILRTADGNFELFKDKHGFVLGAMDNMKYTNYQMQLEKGGMLYLYTDGVPEATNEHQELFGIRQLLDVLNSNRTAGPVELLDAVRTAVYHFTGEADQFDDLTMLAITRR